MKGGWYEGKNRLGIGEAGSEIEMNVQDFSAALGLLEADGQVDTIFHAVTGFIPNDKGIWIKVMKVKGLENGAARE